MTVHFYLTSLHSHCAEAHVHPLAQMTIKTIARIHALAQVLPNCTPMLVQMIKNNTLTHVQQLRPCQHKSRASTTTPPMLAQMCMLLISLTRRTHDTPKPV